jgi:hypothetical protein
VRASGVWRQRQRPRRLLRLPLGLPARRAALQVGVGPLSHAETAHGGTPAAAPASEAIAAASGSYHASCYNSCQLLMMPSGHRAPRAIPGHGRRRRAYRAPRGGGAGRGGGQPPTPLTLNPDETLVSCRPSRLPTQRGRPSLLPPRLDLSDSRAVWMRAGTTSLGVAAAEATRSAANMQQCRRRRRFRQLLAKSWPKAQDQKPMPKTNAKNAIKSHKKIRRRPLDVLRAHPPPAARSIPIRITDQDLNHIPAAQPLSPTGATPGPPS